MTDSEALKWISISFVIYYTIGTSLSLYVAQRYILRNQSKKKIALFALVYLVLSKPLQIWILSFNPFKDDAGHIWSIAIEAIVLFTVITLFTKIRWYKTLIISLGAILSGFFTLFLIGRLDVFDLGKYLH